MTRKIVYWVHVCFLCILLADVVLAENDFIVFPVFNLIVNGTLDGTFWE